MPEEEISAGDVVRLKSGGPLMTVDILADFAPMGPKNGVRCIWFDGKVKTVDVFTNISSYNSGLYKPLHINDPVKRTRGLEISDRRF